MQTVTTYAKDETGLTFKIETGPDKKEKSGFYVHVSLCNQVFIDETGNARALPFEKKLAP